MTLQLILLDGSENGASSGAKINKGFNEIERKEDKVPGKGLSTEDFTTALKNKLVLHEGSHFKGTHPDLTQLTHFNPSPEPGSYAFLAPGVGLDVTMAVWDNGQSKWEDIGTGGGGTPLTASQIKSLYESNADTNAFTDAFLKALTGIVFDQLNTRTKFGQDIEVPTQTLSQDPNITGKDNRLITVANSYAMEAALKNFVDQHFMPALDPDNPTMQLRVSPTGSAAQMQVLNNGHNVATMEWLKSTQEFVFNLADKDTGVTKATFEIKPDGNAYIGGKKVAVTDTVMSDKGVITDTLNISSTGIYHGTDVANSPVTGPIMVMASKDAAGDLGYFLMGSDQLLHTGGRVHGGSSINWNSVAYGNSLVYHVGKSAGNDFNTLTEAFNYISSNDLGNYTLMLTPGEVYDTNHPSSTSFGWKIYNAKITLRSTDMHAPVQPKWNLNATFQSNSGLIIQGIDITLGNYHSTFAQLSIFGVSGYLNVAQSTITLGDGNVKYGSPQLMVSSNALFVLGKKVVVKHVGPAHMESIRISNGGILDLTNQSDTSFNLDTPTANSYPIKLAEHSEVILGKSPYPHPKSLSVIGFEYLLKDLGANITIMQGITMDSNGKGVRASDSLGRLYYDKTKVGASILATVDGLGFPNDGTFSNGSCQLDMSSASLAYLNASGSMPTAYRAVRDQDIATVRTIREFRTTITHNIANHAKPTLAECKEVFKLLPHFDWKKDDDFYIKDSTGGKIVLVKYRGIPAGTEAAPGNFFYEVLSAAV